MLQTIRQCKKSRVQKGNILCGSYSVCITLMHVILYDKALHNFLIRLLNQNLGSVTWAKNHTEFTSTSVMFNDPNKTMHLKTTITVAELQWLFLKNMKMQSKNLPVPLVWSLEGPVKKLGVPPPPRIQSKLSPVRLFVQVHMPSSNEQSPGAGQLPFIILTSSIAMSPV